MLDTLTKHYNPQLSAGFALPRILEGMAAHRAAEGFRLELRVVPDQSAVSVASNGTYEGRITVPNASRLWGITATSSAAAGFDLQLRAPDLAQPLFGRRLNHPNASGQPAPGAVPFSRMFMLPRPLLIFREDQPHAHFLVQVWNRAAVVNTIQAVLWFMSPEV